MVSERLLCGSYAFATQYEPSPCASAFVGLPRPCCTQDAPALALLSMSRQNWSYSGRSVHGVQPPSGGTCESRTRCESLAYSSGGQRTIFVSITSYRSAAADEKSRAKASPFIAGSGESQSRLARRIQNLRKQLESG